MKTRTNDAGVNDVYRQIMWIHDRCDVGGSHIGMPWPKLSINDARGSLAAM